MRVSAKELARMLGGTIDGDPDIELQRPATIEEAGVGCLTFLANPKYESFLYQTEASAVLVSKEFIPSQPVTTTLIRVDNVYEAMATLTESFKADEFIAKGIHPTASIHELAEIDEDVTIGAHSVIGPRSMVGRGTVIMPQVYVGQDVAIGSGCIIHSGVRIYRNTIIGDNCVFHANTVIGSDGFGFVTKEDGTYKKIEQIGNVIIKDNVEIGANTVIDRGSLGPTIIGEGVKLDNLIQIAHNANIGQHTVIAAQAGIAGSTKIGRNCRIGGQAGIVGHLQLGDYTEVQAQSGVTKSVPKGNQRLYGMPAINYNDYLRSYVHFKRLPALEKRIAELELLVTQLEGKTT